MRKLLVLFVAVLLTACVTPGQPQLSETSKIALQSVSEIAVRRYIREHPGRATEIAANIRHVAAELQSVTAITTVSGLRLKVEAELAKLPLSDIDRQDAVSLLNIFEALLREQIGSDSIDSKSLVKMSDFLSMILAALSKA